MFDLADCGIEAGGVGCHLQTEDGREYIDFAGSYGVFALGYGNKQVREAAANQLHNIGILPPGFESKLTNQLKTRISEEISWDVDPRDIVISNSGSEAIEIALLAAILAKPGRQGMVTCDSGYHGKTLGTCGLIGQAHLREPFGENWQDVRLVKYGSLEDAQKAITEEVRAVLLEPVLGGNFLKVPPPNYLSAVYNMAQEAGAWFIADEVQTGFGRTGRMFGVDHDPIEPDVLVASKALTGGQTAFAATIFRRGVLSQLDSDALATFNRIISSLSTSTLSCASALQSLEIITTKQLPARCAMVGAKMRSQLGELQKQFPTYVRQVRGIGLMSGIQMSSRALEYCLWLQLLKRNVIGGLSLNPAEQYPVLRLYPPFEVEEEDVDTVMIALRDSLTELSRLPAGLYGAANVALSAQNYLPKPLIRMMMKLLA